MLRKKDLARIIHDRYRLRGGRKIPLYLGEWMVDYVFNAIKIALIEDGEIEINNHVNIKRIDIPEHPKRMPDNTYITIPERSKIRVNWRSKFMEDVNKGEVEEIE